MENKIKTVVSGRMERMFKNDPKLREAFGNDVSKVSFVLKGIMEEGCSTPGTSYLLKYLRRSIFDQMMGSLSREETHCIGCTTGDCCKQEVLVCEDEVHQILEHAKTNKIDIDIERLKMQKGQDFLQMPAWERKCVFLSDANRCQIYPVRPLSCLILLASKEGPYACDQYEGKSAMIVNYMAEILAAAYYASVIENEHEIGSLNELLIKCLNEGSNE